MANALPSDLTELERSVLTNMLNHPGEPFASVSAQLAHATISKRERTGVGFYTNFALPPAARIPPDLANTELGGVGARHPELSCGAGFILFVRDGVVSFLEGFTYDDPWPPDESSFTVLME